jgi:Tol biopolymer transport system component
MSLPAGSRLGPYEIGGPIGAGGMGEVYRARDGKLGRDAALKVLPTAFAADPDRMARFQREAQVLASLNHPHIAAIYGLEESDGIQALAMELVEGPTLEDRIAQAPIPLEDALRIAQQVAEALEYAHEKGIVHRDLKPANVKLTPEGAAKVLDFGLAKALTDDQRSGGDPFSSPTLTMRATQAGMILGTAAYMSPEQAHGKAADRRADIWSFAALLYEMLAGKRAFTGESVSDTLASVLKFEPDWEALPKDTPAAIRKLLHRCLTKDRQQRLQAIGEARIAIADYLANPAEVAAAAKPADGRVLPWAAAAVVLGALALAVSFVHFRESPPVQRVTKLSLLPPEKTIFGPIVVSPDGRRLAFTATDVSGKVQLWVRSLDSLSAQPLTAAEGGAFRPFWSPDSRFIGFFADNKLKKIEASGGPPLTLCDAPMARGGAWNREGVIIAGGLNVPLFRVPAAGGEARPLTTLEQARRDIDHRWPVFLPDGQHYLYTVRSSLPDNAGIYLGALGSKERIRLLGDESNAAYVAASDGGYLLFIRGETLMAQPFLAGKFQLSGEPFPVAEQLGFNSVFALGAFSVSENGVLVYDSTGSNVDDQLTWFDRAGKRLGVVGERSRHMTPSLSPDERQVVIDGLDPQARGFDLYIIELTRGVSTRFTFDPRSDSAPVWSPDGSRIAFASNRESTYNLYQKIASGAGQDELLLKSDRTKLPTDWSLDGRFLLYHEIDPKTRYDLWVLPMSGDRKPIPFLQTEFNERNGVFSPDGKWVAYDSDESRKKEVYVQPFPASGGKWQISKNGGTVAKWRRDGKELFYLGADGKMMAVAVTAGGTFQAGIPEPLFDSHISSSLAKYAVTRDGRRFLIPSVTVEASSSPATVVINWTAGVRR